MIISQNMGCLLSKKAVKDALPEIIMKEVHNYGTGSD